MITPIHRAEDHLALVPSAMGAHPLGNCVRGDAGSAAARVLQRLIVDQTQDGGVQLEAAMGRDVVEADDQCAGAACVRRDNVRQPVGFTQATNPPVSGVLATFWPGPKAERAHVPHTALPASRRGDLPSDVLAYGSCGCRSGNLAHRIAPHPRVSPLIA